MITLPEIREKYPQYNNLPDEDLLGKLHNKYYSSMPINEFYSKVGYSRPETKGWGGVAQDVGSSLTGAYGDIKQFLNDPARMYEAARNLTNEASQGVQQFTGEGPRRLPFQPGIPELKAPEPMRGAKNLLAGLAEATHGAAAMPGYAGDYLERKGILGPGMSKMLIPRPREKRNYAEELGLGVERGGDKFVRTVGELLPYMLGGEAGLAGKGLTRATAQRAGALGAHAIGQNEDPVKAALYGAIPAIPGAAYATGKGAANLINKTGKGIREFPETAISKFYGQNIPEEELLRNLQSAQGTETGLGRILNSPTLSGGYESFTSKTPFGGGNRALSGLEQQIENKGHKLIEDLSPHKFSGDPNKEIHQILINAKNKENEIKNDLWKPVTKLEKEQKFVLRLPQSTGFAKENMQSIMDSPLYKHNDKFRKAFSKLMGITSTSEKVPSVILGPNGRPLVSRTNNTSIAQARTIADDLFNTGKKIVGNPNAADQEIGKTFIKLAAKMRDEINAEIASRGSPELRHLDEKAMKNYKDNYVGFLDKDIHKMIESGSLSETFINEIIKPGKNADRADLILKVKKLLPESERSKIGQAYLAKFINAEGLIDVRELLKGYNSLGPRQKKALFSPEQIEQIESYRNLVRLNPEAVNIMYNPKTGFRESSTKQLIDWSKLLPGILTGQLNLFQTAATTGGQVLLSRLFNNMMQSEAFREKVAAKILKGRGEK